MTEKQSRGWRELVEGYPWFEEKGCYPIPVYSESMPAPRLGHSVYGDIDRLLFDEEDVFGWRVPEVDQEYELNSGLERIADQVLAQKCAPLIIPRAQSSTPTCKFSAISAHHAS